MMLSKRLTLTCAGMALKASLLTFSGIVSRPIRWRLFEACLTISLRLRLLPSTICQSRIRFTCPNQLASRAVFDSFILRRIQPGNCLVKSQQLSPTL